MTRTKACLNKKFEFEHECIGLVGINESGKSNILKALGCLSSENRLKRSDSPKMVRGIDAKIRYLFSPSDEEISGILSVLDDWSDSTEIQAIEPSKKENVVIEYTVEFDRALDEEVRSFSINGIGIPKNVFALHPDALIEGCSIVVGGARIELESAVLVTEKTLAAHDSLIELGKRRDALVGEMSELDEALSERIEMRREQEADEAVEDDENEEEEEGVQDDDQISDVENENTAIVDHSAFDDVEIVAIQENIAKLSAEIEKINKTLGIHDFLAEYDNAKESVDVLESNIEDVSSDIDAKQEEFDELEETNTDSQQDEELKKTKRSLSTLRGQLTKYQAQLRSAKEIFSALSQPMREKFTADTQLLADIFGGVAQEYILGLLPKVVFWQHSEEFILPGEFEFECIENAETINDISRPLVNLFRIGLGVHSLESLKEVINEIQQDGSERSRYGEQLNRKIDEYLKSVWENYDQKLKISLEQERIRIEFYDPKCESASYYNMRGCPICC